MGVLLCVLIGGLSGPVNSFAQFDYDDPPVDYDEREPADRVHDLATRLQSGEAELQWSTNHGWLPAVLDALDVPRKSQTLVFSKTSQQIRRIDPSRPRALYFTNDVYVGWVQNGDFVEIAAVDPEQGAVFYKLEQKLTKQPVIKRDSGQCLSCHATGRTQDVPGFLVRSVFAKRDGHPIFHLGTTTTNHTTPFHERFGGWYVTGSHGAMRHRGNVIATDNPKDPINEDAGANLNKLPGRVETAKYLEPTSDIVALMLLEHQTQFHNRVTKASYECRQALHYQTMMNRVLERGEDHETDSTRRRIERAAENLVRYVLFCDECPLTSPVAGDPEFQTEFEKRGVKDKKGRSLRELDLKTRIMKYPCSYLIYEPSFAALPNPILERVKARLTEILRGKDTTKEFAHLSASDRQSIFEILTDTHELFAAE